MCLFPYIKNEKYPLNPHTNSFMLYMLQTNDLSPQFRYPKLSVHGWHTATHLSHCLLPLTLLCKSTHLTQQEICYPMESVKNSIMCTFFFLILVKITEERWMVANESVQGRNRLCIHGNHSTNQAHKECSHLLNTFLTFLVCT